MGECETGFWLDYRAGTEVVSWNDVREIRSETEQLTRMSYAIKTKMKAKLKE